jgi:hypothetical protein
MICLLPPPPPTHLPSVRPRRKTEKYRHLADGREEGGCGTGANSYDGEKAWSSIYHSLLPGLKYSMGTAYANVQACDNANNTLVDFSAIPPVEDKHLCQGDPPFFHVLFRCYPRFRILYSVLSPYVHDAHAVLYL